MWTVSACSLPFCVSCEREQTPLSIPHWILLICTDHALILRYRAASPLPQETLQIDIWQLGGEEGGWGCLSLPFCFSTVNMWPSATHLGLEGTFLLWLWMPTAESVPQKLPLTTVSVTNGKMNKEKEECLSHLSTLFTLSFLEGEIAECWSTVAVWVNVFFCSGLETLGPDMCRGPCWSSQGLSSFLIFLAATATRARHFSAAFIFKCKACNGRR